MTNFNQYSIFQPEHKTISVNHITREIGDLLNQLHVSIKLKNNTIYIEVTLPDHLKNNPINLNLVNHQIEGSGLTNKFEQCDSINSQKQKHITPNSLQIPEVNVEVYELLNKYMQMCKSLSFRPTKKLFCQSFCEQNGVLMRYGSMRVHPLFKQLWVDAIKRNRIQK